MTIKTKWEFGEKIIIDGKQTVNIYSTALYSERGYRPNRQRIERRVAMGTEWKSQQCFDEGKYYLQFETDDKDKFKFMEKSAQLAIDGKLDIKTEVAREIFEDIEHCVITKHYAELHHFVNSKGGRCWGKTVKLTAINIYNRLRESLAELKNKYTKEGGGE